MNFFRQINRRTLLLWSVLLCLALLCAQGVKLHVHNLDQEHGSHSSDYLGVGQVVADTGDHSHLSVAHLAHDISHDEHHGDLVSEVDTNPYGLLKKSPGNPFAIALCVLFFTLVIFISSGSLIQRCRESKLVLHRRYALSPPLRAPPLH